VYKPALLRRIFNIFSFYQQKIHNHGSLRVIMPTSFQHLTVNYFLSIKRSVFCFLAFTKKTPRPAFSDMRKARLRHRMFIDAPCSFNYYHGKDF